MLLQNSLHLCAHKHGVAQIRTPAPTITTSLYAPSPTYTSSTFHFRHHSHARKPCVHYRSLLVSPSLAPSPSFLPLPSRVRSTCHAHPPSVSASSDPQRNNISRHIGPGGVQQPSSNRTPRRKAEGAQGEHALLYLQRNNWVCIFLRILGVHTATRT